jgi:hypothetical protein
MNAEVKTGAIVTDQFPAFKSDGYTKQTGLTVGAGDFVVTVWRDSNIVVVPVTIGEIASSGDYKVTFVPPVNGLYRVEVFINLNKEIWFCKYQAVTELTNTQAQKIDQIVLDLARVLGLLHQNAIVDRHDYDVNGQLSFARLRIFDSLANLPTVPDGSETTGLLFEYEFNATYSGLGIQTVWLGKKVL